MRAPAFSRRYRAYLFAVTVAGPVAALAVAAHGMGEVLTSLQGNPYFLVQIGLLLLLAVLFQWMPLRVGKDYTVDLGDVAVMAMLALLPTALPGLLVLLAGGVEVLLRRSRNPDGSLFNLGQYTIIACAGALTIKALSSLGEPVVDLRGSAPALAAAAVVMIALNMCFLSGAISLQTGVRYRRIFRQQIAGIGGFGTYLLLCALGVLLALVARDYPVAVPVLLIPAFSLHLATRRAVALRDETRAAMTQMIEVVELRDPYTVGHSRRVAQSARELALRLGLTSEEADMIETAGHVHDLGKVAVSPQILLKYGPLDERDWREVKRHPEHGALVVDRFSAYHGCAEMVRYHHERWDGTGYPRGLAGEAIPFGSRILAVADAYDAMTHLRSYRAAKSQEATLAILEEGAGTQWDPTIVRVMVEMQREAAAEAAAAAAAGSVAGAPRVAHA